MSSDIIPDGAIVVAAHPDDEALWFSSLLQRAAHIVLCFADVSSRPDCSFGRRTLRAEYPLPHVTWLGLTESEVFEAADWRRPKVTAHGVGVRWHRHVMPGYSRQRYLRNFATLVRRLRPILQKAPAVISHGPWGEYGHEEHVQVFRAVDQLRKELGFRQYFPAYASAKSMRLANQYLPALPPVSFMLPTDVPMANVLRGLYMRHDCWTWFADYDWPATESFMEWSGQSQRTRQLGSLVPLNMVEVGMPAARPFFSSLFSPAGWRVRLRDSLGRGMPNSSGEPIP